MRQAQITMITAVCVLVAGLCGGCGTDYDGRRIIQPDTGQGKLDLAFRGPGKGFGGSDISHESRRIEASDGVEIDVWVLKAKGDSPSRGTMLILHGLGWSKASFPYLGAGERLAKMGYDVVLPDLRAHGDSGGKYITYGAKEKHDVKSVMDALIADGTVNESVYAFGVTLGAATAIQYAAIDPRCKAVFAMTPYKDGLSMARFQLSMLSDEDFQKAVEKAEGLADFKFADSSSVAAAADLTAPLLLAHGILELSPPKEHSDAIFAAAGGPKKLLPITPGPEQIALFAIMEDWIAEKMNTLATEGLPAEGLPAEAE